MSIRYSQGANDDLAPLKSTPIDDDSATGFWGGAQRCFVQVALAAVLAATTLSTALAEQIQQRSGDQSDVPAGSLVKSTALDYNEFWQNQVAPVPSSLYQNLPLGEKDDLPAGSLFGEPDEDYWLNPIFALPAVGGVQPATLYQRLPYLSGIGGDQSDVPAGSLKKFTSPDEDYWQNPIFALPAVGGVAPAGLYQLLPYSSFDAGETAFPAAPLDEDLWQNPVWSAQA